jgi:hypothetical protein
VIDSKYIIGEDSVNDSSEFFPHTRIVSGFAEDLRGPEI